MRISRDEAVGVAHQHQIAVALKLVAGIGDNAILGRLDRRAFRHREIDAIVLQAIRLGSESGDNPAPHRPAEARHVARGCCRLDRVVFDGGRSGRGKPCAVRQFHRGETGSAGRSRRRVDARGDRRRPLPHVRNDDAVADPHPRVRGKIVGSGNDRNRLAIEPRDAVERLARRHDMNDRGSYQPAARSTDGGRLGRCDARLRRRRRRRGGTVTGNDEVFARIHGCRAGDVVCFHDGGDGHAVLPRNPFERLARPDRDRRAALPGPSRRRRRGRDRAGDIAVGLVGAHAAAAARTAIISGGEVRQRPAFDMVGRRGLRD